MVTEPKSMNYTLIRQTAPTQVNVVIDNIESW